MPHTITSDDEYYDFLRSTLLDSRKSKDLLDKICNLPFEDKYHATALDLGIIVFLEEAPETNTINRVALSRTEQAMGAVRMTSKPFEDIKIPLDNKKNILTKVFNEQKVYWTNDWYYIFTPELGAEEARFNQAGAGIACSVVYPLDTTNPRRALIFSYFQNETQITKQHHDFMKHYVAIASEALNT